MKNRISSLGCAEEANDKRSGADRREDAMIDNLLMAESTYNMSIEEQVARMIEDDKYGIPISEAIDPVDKFKEMYNTIKAAKKDDKKADAASMLKSLFPEQNLSTPFDERKVMMKLRKDLDEQDFKDTFINKNVGDIF